MQLPRRIATLGILIILGAGMNGCASASHAAAPKRSGGLQTTPATQGLRPGEWLVTRQALAEISSDPRARARIAMSTVDELLKPGQMPLPGVAARTFVVFSSASDLEGAVRSRSLPPHLFGVMYDPEAWPFTPVAEQHHPVAAAARASTVAHASGLQFLVAPALNLVKVLSPATRRSRASEFVALKLVRRMARTADLIELQAQSLERSTRAYRDFVFATARQARSANPQVHVLAGLSTNPPGLRVGLPQLQHDIAATRSQVAGYWLNVPGRGAKCPTCNSSRPGLAIALTRRP